MTSWLAWGKGRMLWLPAITWALALIVVYAQWWQFVNAPAPHNDSYQVIFLDIIPVIAGLIGIYGILPRMDWIDAQAVTHPARRDLIAATVLIGMFALIPALMRWLFTLNPFYTSFIPSNYSASDPAQLDYSLPWRVIWPYVVFIVAVLALGVLLTGLVGRLFGPILGVLGYLGALYIQGYKVAPDLFPRMMQRDAPDIMPATNLIIPLTTLIIGLIIFRLSGSGVIRIGDWFRRIHFR